MKNLKGFLLLLIAIVLLNITTVIKTHAQGLNVGFDEPFEVKVDYDSQYYNFEVNEPGKLTMKLDADDDVFVKYQLIKDNETVFIDRIFGKFNSNKETYYHTYDLLKGKYTLVFTQYYTSFGDLTAKLSFESIKTDETSTNNVLFDKAQKIDLKQTFNGYVDSIYGIDYYKFTLEKPAVVKVGIEGYLNKYTAFKLLDSTKKEVFNEYQESSYTDSAILQKTVRLNPGDYYIAVYAKDDYSTGKYQLKLNADEVVNTEKEPNNGVSAAQNLLFGSTLNGFLAWNDTSDYFSFKVNKKGKYQIHFTSSLHNSTYYKVYNQDYELIGDFVVSDTSVEMPKRFQSELELEKGLYYISVYSGSYNTQNEGKYDLTILGDGITKFKDFTLGAYWTTPFAWGFDKNIIKGDTSVMKLSPNGQISEAQWLAMLLRHAYNIKDSTTGKWYDSYYAKAKDLGLNISNKPSSKLTRGQVAQMLSTIVEGKSMTEREAVAWMYEKELTTGVNPAAGPTYENFNPNGNMTRAYAVTFMYRLFEK